MECHVVVARCHRNFVEVLFSTRVEIALGTVNVRNRAAVRKGRSTGEVVVCRPINTSVSNLISTSVDKDLRRRWTYVVGQRNDSSCSNRTSTCTDDDLRDLSHRNFAVNETTGISVIILKEPGGKGIDNTLIIHIT
jgi:hypothetical protein